MWKIEYENMKKWRSHASKRTLAPILRMLYFCPGGLVDVGNQMSVAVLRVMLN